MIRLFKKFFMGDNFTYYVFGTCFSLLFLIYQFVFFKIKFIILSLILIKIVSLIIIAYFVKQIIKIIDTDNNYEINRLSENVFSIILFSFTHLATYFIYLLVNFIDANIEASKDYLSIKVKNMIHKKEEPKEEKNKETYRD